MNTENRAVKSLKTAKVYLYVTIFCILFGAIYEYFSFGVYSYFMIYAFLWPLILGVLPFMVMSGKCIGVSENGVERKSGDLPEKEENLRAYRFWHAGVATLTVGSIFKGILAIYGTTSPFTKGYFLVGGILLIIAMMAPAVRNLWK